MSKHFKETISIDDGSCTVDEACQWLCIGRTKIYTLINDKELETFKIGTATRIIPRSLFEYRERQIEAQNAGTK